jgi:hypothetical protein
MIAVTLNTLSIFASERILLSDSKIATIELNQTNVRCSAIGYGLAELKVNIKALDGWTLFNHSNINSGDLQGLPCMTAGACKRFDNDKNGLSIEDIILSGTRTETIKVNRQIVEVKTKMKNEENMDVCHRRVEERLQTSVTRENGNGKINFTHVRFGIDENFPLEFCK